MKKVHTYLVSDSTGETVLSVARSSLAHFEDIAVEEHLWSLVRNKKQLDKLAKAIEENPGVVLYTMVNRELTKELHKICEEKNTPCIAVLSSVIEDLSAFLKMRSVEEPGRQHVMNKEYFSRVEAINFALAHDDGQSTRDIDGADIVLVGASRTSKSPTCIYLAYRGFKAANIPFVRGVPMPEEILKAKNPLVVGLTISSDRLVDLRKSRLLSLHGTYETNYIDIEDVRDEVNEAKRFFYKQEWPVIEVTRRSVEETAAKIIQLYERRKTKLSLE